MSHKVSSCEVLVAGGGIIGAACARAAARRGMKVLICEPGPDPAAASAASAGILGPQIERTDEALRALGLRARDLYESLAPALAESTGIDIGLWRDGIASLAFDEPEAEQLRDAVAHQRQAGLRCDWLEAEEVAERFPATAPCLGAMFAPEDGAVDAPALARALHADAKRHGARTLNSRVTRLTTILGRAIGVAPWPANMPRTVLYYDHGYVLARSGEAIFGSTMEHVGFDGHVTESGVHEIVSAARRLLPQLPTVPIRTWAGLRPITPDGRPIVGPDPDVRGLWYATGHGRNGVLLAGLTGEIIGDLVATGTTDVEIASLAPERFTS